MFLFISNDQRQLYMDFQLHVIVLAYFEVGISYKVHKVAWR